MIDRRMMSDAQGLPRSRRHRVSLLGEGSLRPLIKEPLMPRFALFSIPVSMKKNELERAMIEAR
jgi:hypothetical protein